MGRYFVILHGWMANGPDHWQTWLAERLQATGAPVCYPVLPDPDRPQLEPWLDVLETLLPAERDTTVGLPLARLPAVAAPPGARRAPGPGAARRPAVGPAGLPEAGELLPRAAGRARRGLAAGLRARRPVLPGRRGRALRLGRAGRRDRGGAHLNPEAGLRPVAGGRGVVPRSGQRGDELADRARVAPADAAVAAVEQLQRVVGAELVELLRERQGAEVQEVLVAACRRRGRCASSSAARRRAPAPSGPGPWPATAPTPRRSAGPSRGPPAGAPCPGWRVGRVGGRVAVELDHAERVHVEAVGGGEASKKTSHEPS